MAAESLTPKMGALPVHFAPATDDFRGFLPAFHNRLSRLLRNVEADLERGAGAEVIYSREAVARRLLQETSFLLEPQLRRADAARVLAGRLPLADEKPKFRCAGLVVDARTGHVRPGIILWLSSLARFGALWLAMLWFGACAIAGRRSARPETLVIGVPEEGLFRGDDADFAAFARGGQIAPFAAARRLLVQSLKRDARSTDAPRIRYARHPLFERISSGPAGLSAFMRLAGRHLATAAVFLAHALRTPLLAVLWRDFACHAPVACANEQGLIEAVVLTNSNWGRQPLWMLDMPGRQFEAHMVFYSQHDRPPVYNDMPECLPAHPTTRLLRADHFWVWTPGQAAMLKREGVRGHMHAVGPILWEPDRRAHAPRTQRWISVFDIMPLSDEANRNIGFLGNYYATANLKAFLDGIEKAVSTAGINLPLVVKPKRGSASWHDPAYLEKLSSSKTLRLLPAKTPVLDVVAESAVSIVYPYSSVAYVADWAGVPAIYFDPTGRLAATFEPAAKIRFASNVTELATALRELTGSL